MQRVVVRGGTNRDPGNVVLKVRDAIADGDGPVLSVYCADVVGDEVQAAVREAVVCGDIPHGQVQVADWDDLVEAGMTPVQFTAGGEPACHHHVTIDPPDVDKAEDFIRCFEPPIDNPIGGRRKRA